MLPLEPSNKIAPIIETIVLGKVIQSIAIRDGDAATLITELHPKEILANGDFTDSGDDAFTEDALLAPVGTSSPFSEADALPYLWHSLRLRAHRLIFIP